MKLKKLLLIMSFILVFSLVSCSNSDTKKDTKSSTEKSDEKNNDEKKDDAQKDTEQKDAEKKDESKDKKDAKFTEKDGIVENDYFKVTLEDGWEVVEEKTNGVNLEISKGDIHIYAFPDKTNAPKEAAEFRGKNFKNATEIKEITINNATGVFFENPDLNTTYVFLPVKASNACFKIEIQKASIEDVKTQLEKFESKL